MCKILYKNCEKHIVYITNTKFRKELNSKKFKKRIYFPILKETQPTSFFRTIGVFTSLGVAMFRVTLRDHSGIFVKMATNYENDMTQFVFTFSTRIKCEE